MDPQAQAHPDSMNHSGKEHQVTCKIRHFELGFKKKK